MLHLTAGAAPALTDSSPPRPSLSTRRGIRSSAERARVVPGPPAPPPVRPGGGNGCSSSAGLGPRGGAPQRGVVVPLLCRASPRSTGQVLNPGQFGVRDTAPSRVTTPVPHLQQLQQAPASSHGDASGRSPQHAAQPVRPRPHRPPSPSPGHPRTAPLPSPKPRVADRPLRPPDTPDDRGRPVRTPPTADPAPHRPAPQSRSPPCTPTHPTVAGTDRSVNPGRILARPPVRTGSRDAARAVAHS